MAEHASHLSSRSAASDVFDALAATYDAQEFENPIFRWMRRRVWDRCLANFQPGSEILELNCGTGIDAAFLVSQGLRVVATDISDEMVSHARRKIEVLNGSAFVRIRKLDFRDLSSLRGCSFDGALSNFGGLNCAKDLEGLARDLASLLKPGAVFVACVMPRLALWELAFGLLRADKSLLTRRLRKHGVTATVRGKQLTVHYYSPSTFCEQFSPHFDVLRATGLGLFVPPPYGTKFASRYPRLTNTLLEWETIVAHRFPFRHVGDHTILELRRR